ncbi:MAG: DUF5686 and carboxypeptidase regulatory-like domain-containing protein [Salinivirgaceae bacterium]
MAFKLFFLFLFLIPLNAYLQEIRGTISNDAGNPIAYATIYIDELQTGTSANHLGKFTIKVSPGTYHVNFRSMGYSPISKEIEITTASVELQIVLPMQSYILAGVTVRADAEDPAYSIMRKAIARAPGFVKQAESFTSEVYIKGSAVATKIPKVLQKRMEVNGEQPQVGQVYVNESLNRMRFKAPDNYVQEVISVNNSFPMADENVPVIGLISNSIYESQPDFYISPFAPNAFSHYNYSYEGLLQDGAWFIDKIKVTPKRKSKLLMEGYVYIVEDLWCLYSYDMILNPPYAELNIKQHYGPVKGNNYFPVNLFVEAKLAFMGIKAEATYTTTIKYDSVVINPAFSQDKISRAISQAKEPVEEEEVPKNPKVQEIETKLEELYTRDELSNREMMEMQKLMAKKATLLEEEKKDNPLELTSNYKQIVNKDALKRDSVYWDSVRPVPASPEEKISYKKLEEKKAKEDSASWASKAAKIALFGNYEWERSKKFHLYYPGLLNLRNYRFSPVDGWSFNQSFKIYSKLDSIRALQIKGMAGYAFARESLFGKGQLTLWYNRLKNRILVLDGGYLANDFNNYTGTPEFMSSVYNLFLKENYIKFYNDAFIELTHETELIHGMKWRIKTKYQQTSELQNNTNFSFLYPNKTFAANSPINKTISQANLDQSELFRISNTISYTPKQYFEISNGRKRNLHSKWPTFETSYNWAIPLTTGFSAYHQLEFGLQQTIDYYSVSSIYYRANAGVFFNKEHMHFSSFKHFKTISEFFTIQNFRDGFFLLNNYEYSTATHYLETQFRYTTQFLILKRLPIISNQYWTENLYLNTLWVDKHSPYYEAGYSLGQIMFAGELGVFVGFKGSEFHGVGIRGTFVF